MEKKNKKSQSFSTDILVVIVIILFGVLFLVMNKINTQQGVDINLKYKQADAESKVVFENFKTTGILDNENKVNMEKLLTLDQAKLKAELGIKNDFAIVFEKDGKLVKIDPQKNINCIGSKNIVINGVTCK